MKHALKALVFCALFYAHAMVAANGATTLLPNGKNCFSNANGPIISGSLNMFVPATTTPKATWQDSGQVTQNSQPIQLDADGCAIIYGVGQYRQQVYTGPVVAGATSGTLVWDQLTTDTSAFNSVFWAALSSGTANAITVVDTGFNATDGTVIQFVALSTNTGATTLNPSGYGAISVVKDTTAGPVALTGGEITAGNVISVVYYANGNQFHLLNAVIQSASGTTSPLCGFNGLTVTNNAATPSTIINLTANQAVTQNSAGLVVNRSSISLTAINISTGNVTATANGMDGEAVGTSQWLYVWLIDSGAAAAGLVSTSATAPTMPSGYTYKCLAAAMQVDGSGNLYRIETFGNRAYYKMVLTSNTVNYGAAPFLIDSLAKGTYSTTNPVMATPTIRGNGFCVPPIANSALVLVSNNYKGGALSAVYLAPSSAWGGNNQGVQGSNGMLWPAHVGNSVATIVTAWIQLEADTVGWASSAAGAAIGCQGWTNGGINAN